ncbi:MAG: DNA polymerase I [Syntrophales bacterium]|jgi:DNA polymerase-1|nr:DNA polymerase I [Syntrophales bacterium]
MAEKSNHTKTLMLIDGSNYIYRAFYAIRELSNSKGFPTNAIYGFTNMLMKLCRERKPDYISVVFDSKGPTFRHEAYNEYKANRTVMPDELSMQIPFIKKVIQAFSIACLELPGIEADDIIGTLVKKYEGYDGLQIVLVSGDKDLMQLLSGKVSMIDTMKDKSYDVEGVKERFGVGPEKVVEILGLAGDTSDNIPGVPGIGEKTAQKLVIDFGSLEGILQNLDKIKNARVRHNMEEFAEQARISRELATIKTDLDLEVPLEDLAVREPDVSELKDLFAEFEFSSLIQQIKGEDEIGDAVCHIVSAMDEFDECIEGLQKAKGFAFEFTLAEPGESGKAEILGLALSVDKSEACYIPFRRAGIDDGLDFDIVFAKLAPLLKDGGIKKWSHDAKRAFLLLSERSLEVEGFVFDTMVAAYVLDPSRRDYSLPVLSRQYLNQDIRACSDLTGTGARAISLKAVPVEKTAACICSSADTIRRLVPLLDEEIEAEGFRELFRTVEMPLIKVLASMEAHGVLVDVSRLCALSRDLRELLAVSEEKIYRLAGEHFKINSPKQLQGILFDKLGLPRGRKTKDGYSTDVEVLTQLARSYELPAEILSYRSYEKLRSTYVDVLPALVNRRTGRIHTSYNQTVTATGRLSSSNPNLQNIPIRTAEGKRIRQAFVAPEGWELLSFDYSQIELRILAHLSEDEELIRAFEDNEDIHRKTASSVFGVFPEMVNGEMRRRAKVINFGIIYGMSPFGLARELDIPQKTAKAYIDQYFHRFDGVKTFIDDTLAQAERDGFVSTLMNRRRYLPEIRSSNAMMRQFAERTAINTPIQGTAADLIKLAMLRIADHLEKNSYKTHMIMQVHDELVFEVPLQEKEEILSQVKGFMEGVIALKVPIVVNVGSGKNWDEAAH